ncbi:MAG: hypothetical protein QXX38_03065 [Candidatus Aenigmatarchaeota archaeon]
MLNKIIGACLFSVGLLIVIGFPDITRYQPESMGRAGIILGLVLIILGLFLMKS